MALFLDIEFICNFTKKMNEEIYSFLLHDSVEFETSRYAFKDSFKDVKNKNNIIIDCWEFEDIDFSLNDLLRPFGIIMLNDFQIFIDNSASVILKNACREAKLLAICDLANLIIIADELGASVSYEKIENSKKIYIEF